MAVVVVGVAEADRRGGEPIVEALERARPRPIRRPEGVWPEVPPGFEVLDEDAGEVPVVDAVGAAADRLDPRHQVDRWIDRHRPAHRGRDMPRRFAEVFEKDIAGKGDAKQGHVGQRQVGIGTGRRPTLPVLLPAAPADDGIDDGREIP